MCTDFGTGPPSRGPSHFPVVSREGGKGWTRRVWWEEGSEECCQVCPFVCGQVGSDLEGPTFGVQVHRPKPRRSHNYLHQPGELCTISFDACSGASDGWNHCPKWRIPSSGRLLAQLSPQPSNTPTFSGEPPSSTSCQHHTSMLSWRWRPWEEKREHSCHDVWSLLGRWYGWEHPPQTEEWPVQWLLSERFLRKAIQDYRGQHDCSLWCKTGSFECLPSPQHQKQFLLDKVCAVCFAKWFLQGSAMPWKWCWHKFAKISDTFLKKESQCTTKPGSWVWLA